MARTLWGNILETLAATGLNTAGKIGVEAFLGPMMAERAAKQEVLKSLIPAMGSETDPTKSASIAQKIKELSGVDLATGMPETNAAGMEVRTPTGANLTAPRGTNLEELAPGITPVPGFVRPAPTLESMKVRELQRVDPMARFNAMFPKDMTIQAALVKAEADRLARAQEGEANRELRKGIADESNATRLAVAEATQALQKANLQQSITAHREKMDAQRKSMGLIAKKLGDQNLSKMTSNLGAIWDDYEKAAKDRNMDRMTATAERYNQALGAFEQANPEYSGHFTPMTPDVTQSWGEYFKGEPGTKVKGYKIAPKESSATPTPTKQPTQPTLTFPRRVRVKGTETIVNSQAEYDALRKGLSK